MPYEELQHIWSKAEDLLSSTDASIVACPGYQSGFAVANAQDPAKPHVVTPLASGEVRCRGCPQYDRLSICSHTVAVAERKAILWKFLAWYKKNRDKANFSQAANQVMPNGRGKKGERAPRKQKSKHGQKAIPTDFVDRCQVPCYSSHTVTASTSCSPAQPTSEMMRAASVQSMVSAMPMTTTGVQSDRSIQAVSAMHTAVSQPATPSQSMPPLPSTLTGSCMQSAAIAIQPAPVQSMVSAMPMTTIRSDGCIQALSAMHMAASQPARVRQPVPALPSQGTWMQSAAITMQPATARQSVPFQGYNRVPQHLDTPNNVLPYHNSNPFILQFQHGNIRKCAGCGGPIDKRSGQPQNLVLQHMERYQYPTGNPFEPIKYTASKERAHYYHARKACVLNRHPYFKPSMIDIGGVQNALSEQHKLQLVLELDVFLP